MPQRTTVALAYHRRVSTVLRHITCAERSSATGSASDGNASDPHPECSTNHGRVVCEGDTITVRCSPSNLQHPAAQMFRNDVTSFICSKSAQGILQPSLSICCLGMSINGAPKALRVSSADSGHPQPKYEPSLVTTISTHNAEDIHEGSTVRVQYQGQIRLATVLKLNEEKRLATVDMNDPLAGKLLEYDVEVISFDAHNAMLQEMFPEPELVPERSFSLHELSQYNGKTHESIYLAVNDIVYDMTSGAKFYGPSGMYGFMAGHDATLPLAKFKLDPRLLNKQWSLTQLDEGELASLANYIKTFNAKYPIVGRLKRP